MLFEYYKIYEYISLGLHLLLTKIILAHQNFILGFQTLIFSLQILYFSLLLPICLLYGFLLRSCRYLSNFQAIAKVNKNKSLSPKRSEKSDDCVIAITTAIAIKKRGQEIKSGMKKRAHS